MKPRADIKAQARATFSAQYGISLGAFVVYGLLVGALSGATFGLAALLLMPPLTVGYSWFCLCIYRGYRGDIGAMLSTGFNNYGRSLGGILWMELFVILWSLLLFIPGIIKALAYSMTPYILADTQNVSATDALKISMRMTNGHKGKVFVMGLSFIGWLLLSALTAGLLTLFYVGPYMQTSFAGLYEELKNNALRTGAIRPEELA
jgi:Predicted integral membrane protein